VLLTLDGTLLGIINLEQVVHNPQYLCHQPVSLIGSTVNSGISAGDGSGFQAFIQNVVAGVVTGEQGVPSLPFP